MKKDIAMKWADKIFPGFTMVGKDKRHILGVLDEKAGTRHFDDARITPHATRWWQQAVALAQILSVVPVATITTTAEPTSNGGPG